jgi:hypothetical protein
MSDGDFPVITPKKSWTSDQWDIYRRMPWTHRKLADMIVLLPGVSRWLAGRAVRYEVRWRKGGVDHPTHVGEHGTGSQKNGQTRS